MSNVMIVGMLAQGWHKYFKRGKPKGYIYVLYKYMLCLKHQIEPGVVQHYSYQREGERLNAKVHF